MEIKDFFTFRSKGFLTTFTAPPLQDPNKNGDECIKDVYELIRGEYRNFKFPILFKQSDGKKMLDMLDTEYVSCQLISDRFKSILEENHLTGWQTYPISLYDKKKKEIFGYHGFSIIGRCGPIDWSKSEVVERRRVPTGPLCRDLKGVHIGLDEWDGTDFFFAGKSLWRVVSAKAAKVLKANKITNVTLYNLAEQEVSEDAVRKR